MPRVLRHSQAVIGQRFLGAFGHTTLKAMDGEEGLQLARHERTHENEEKRKSVLVAEDSITARTLLKAILESAGYRGGLGRRNAQMSGFDLTAKIRADRNLSELPVVLVTALESREDRE